MKSCLFLIASFLLLITPAWALQNKVSITTDENYRYIESNGIPNHTPGRFPNQGNPNTISEQTHSFRVPLFPELTGFNEPRGYLFGVAINGVPFDPGTAEFWNNNRSSGWNYDALSGKIDLGIDRNNAHVQPTGTYHYHGIPEGLLKGASSSSHSPLIGYAADGFPIYVRYGFRDPSDPESGVGKVKPGYKLKRGSRSGGPGGSYDGTFVQDWEYVKNTGDLDSCNGRFGATPEYPDGIYHYFLTDSYPFVPRCFAGEPDPSFAHHQMGGGPGGNRQGPSSMQNNRRPPFPPPPHHRHDF